jgi:chemotaxis protein methyltransferase CheR
MNVRAEIIGKEKHISVMGLLEAKEDRQSLIELLQERNGSAEIHVTFFETKTLPAEIIEILKSRQETASTIPVKVFVFHRQLASYLNRLGVQNTLVFGKSLVQQPQQQPIKAVAIGGSAESLDKIFAIVSALPVADVSIFIVQHFPKDAQNILDTLLQDKTQYKAVLAEHRMKIEENVIYVAPSNFHIKVQNGYILLTQEEPLNYARPSIDVLFESASDEYKGALMAILLCGYGSDGSFSLKKLQVNRSKVIIEDPLDCSAQDMPKSALRTGYYDYKFPLPELVSYVARMIRKDDVTLKEPDIKQFLGALHQKYGYDYQDYSLDSIKRRLQKAMTDRGFSAFTTFTLQVLNDPELFEELFLEFSINVTHFFRNPEVFRAIREQILPYLDTYAHIKIWCAGCSTGEEPYSLAILLDEAGLLKKTQIYATDINPFVIAEAKNGLFSLDALQANVKSYHDSGGIKTFEAYFEPYHNILKIQKRLKEKILFFQHSLVKSGILNEFQLILCRNVLIYFNQSLQGKVLKLFSDSLSRNGFLILGESETLTPHEDSLDFEEYDRKHRIYRKRKVPW